MHLDDIDWAAVFSAVAGGGGVATLARIILGRALADLEKVATTVDRCVVQLATITAKLDAVDDLHKTVADHDRKIVSLDTRSQLHASYNRPTSPHCGN